MSFGTLKVPNGEKQLLSREEAIRISCSQDLNKVGWEQGAGGVARVFFALFLLMDDLVRTIDSDAENVPNEDALQFRRKKGGKMQPEEGVVLNPDFTFDPTGDVYQEAVDARYILQDDVKIGSKPV